MALLGDSRHPLWETRFGLSSRFLDPESGDVEGRQKEEGEQGRDKEAADDREAFNHPTDGDVHILLTGRTASGSSRVS